MEQYIVGIDIGNATTEATLAKLCDDGNPVFLKSTLTETTGIKGTADNISGIITAIHQLLKDNSNITIHKILLNDAAPVIADFAMETITETIITDSALIGHNPDTPGGVGLCVGYTAKYGQILNDIDNYIIVVPKDVGFEDAAYWINCNNKERKKIVGAIVQNDEGTLIDNRLFWSIPIVDEVEYIEDVPLNMPAAIEVAPVGQSVDVLSNPYGLATLFQLNAEETSSCRGIAKALIGNRSAVVIKTPDSKIKTRIIPSGKIQIMGERYSKTVSLDDGADEIMRAVENVKNIFDVNGEPGTNIGGMIKRIKKTLEKEGTGDGNKVCISDIFAVDSYSAVPVIGGLANEMAIENGVAVAAMVNVNKHNMTMVAKKLEKQLNIPVKVHGIEAEMALKGVLTTPGTECPTVMIDIGAGSTDAACIDKNGNICNVHLAGAGNLITMLIQSELNLGSFHEAEYIKKYPLAKIESLYRIRYENGEVLFVDKPLPPQFFSQIVTVSGELDFNIVKTGETIEKIRYVRRKIKRDVISGNIKRALKMIGVSSDLRKHIVLVGGTVLDFEIANILTEEMDKLKITAGKGNIRGVEGPRNAVATGLICDYCTKSHE